MIFVDSNIPMYLVGAPHPNKEAARLLLERCIAEGQRLVTDAEVLQEILHRYSAIKRLDSVKPAFKALLGVVDQVFPVELRDTVRAGRMLMEHAPWSARDALHVAIMQRYDVRRVMTFDVGFERVRGIGRVPMPVAQSLQSVAEMSVSSPEGVDFSANDDVRSLKGLLRKPAKPVTIDKMNAAIRARGGGRT